MSLSRAALACAQAGFAVFPVCPGGKTPLVRAWPDLATTNPEQIEQWWSRWPDANIGAATGPSGRLVVDLDSPAALAAFHSLEGEHGPTPTRTVRTARGWHCHYSAPADAHLGNSAGKLAPGVDTRGRGGYVLLPPSRHPSGALYRWITPLRPVAPLPSWLLEALLPAPIRLPSARLPANCHGEGWAATALAREADTLAATPEGGRNHAACRAAFKVGGIVGAGLLAETHAAEVLVAAAVSAGLPADEADRTVQRALRSGAASPRYPLARSA